MRLSMNPEDLKVLNYQEAMKSSQKSIYSGLLVSVFTSFIGSGVLNSTSYKLPIIGIELTSNTTTIYILAALFFYSGLHCSFVIDRAVKTYDSIKDEELAKTLLYYPSLVNSNAFYQSALAAILYGVWYLIFLRSEIFTELWQSIFTGAILSSPYFYVLKMGKYLAPKG